MSTIASPPAPPVASAPPQRMSRRRWLGLGLGGGALLALGSLLWRGTRPPRSEPVWAVGPWRTVNRSEATIIAALAARLVDPGDVTGAEPPDLEQVARWFDAFLTFAHPEVKRDLRALLAAFDGVGPLAIAVPGRFVNLSAGDQARVLRRWERGPHPMRMGFAALKQLAYMAHYGRDATWSAIGYDGPIVPRGYAGGERSWFDPAWVAADGDDGVGPDGRGRWRRAAPAGSATPS